MCARLTPLPRLLRSVNSKAKERNRAKNDRVVQTKKQRKDEEQSAKISDDVLQQLEDESSEDDEEPFDFDAAQAAARAQRAAPSGTRCEPCMPPPALRTQQARRRIGVRARRLGGRGRVEKPKW